VIGLKWLSVVAMIFSIPLLLSHLIRHPAFTGLPFVLLYFWGLAAVIVVPLCLLAEGLALALSWAPSRAAFRETIVWHAFGFIASAAALLTFLVERTR
jgi:hypothetical protein